MLAKQGWRLLNNLSSLVTQILQARDSRGVVVNSATLVFRVFVTSEIAEAKAVFKGISLAFECGLFPFIVESNDLGAVNLCNGCSFSARDVANIITDIWAQLATTMDITVVHISRSCNLTAHDIAGLVLVLVLMFQFFWARMLLHGF
ncbi:hypothetical protein Ddye_029217 [Dipteronia dyeriana]|uniref:RNase H type-1 domain-containing protein n=1 Tax=Dipteronia dyeriana TaxID=168575 RepID=A0AAD9WLH3_9ROSI|nr:hypothetical protein Ddye_029217 [Dipteronia dyeriana]